MEYLHHDIHYKKQNKWQNPSVINKTPVMSLEFREVQIGVRSAHCTPQQPSAILKKKAILSNLSMMQIKICELS
jgi:hypothetical protein